MSGEETQNKDDARPENEAGTEDQTEGSGDGGDGSNIEKEREELREEMKKLEEDPPEKLEDWPDDERKYETFGGPEGDHSYEEGPEAQLGPSSLRRHEDGRIEIEGEEVDNPDDYKSGDPIEGSTQSLLGSDDAGDGEGGGDGDGGDGDSQAGGGADDSRQDES